MVDKLIYMDGQKAVDIWEGDEGWTILSGEGTDTAITDYYKFIPTLYRGIDLRMKMVASMPFELLKGKTQYDTSADWKNKVGFLPNPKAILQLVEGSWLLSGRSYLFKERSAAATKLLRYHLPWSVTPDIDPVKGLQGFKRPVNSVDRHFKVDDYVYFWPPDPTVEIGPAKNYPAQAAANACGVLLNMDLFAESFMKRGAIKVTLLAVKGMPKESERQKLEDWWSRLVAGVRNAFTGKVFNAEAVTPTVIGEGLKELENTTISEEKREDVALALGTPMSILFANAANYATSQQDVLNYLTGTIIPDCEFIEAVLNEQVFHPLGLHMRFMPETLDAMQEDEAARAQSMSLLITALGTPEEFLLAADILGYEISQETRAQIEAMIAEKEKRREEMATRLAQAPKEEEQPAEDGAETQPEPVQGQQQPQNEKMISDMDRWQRKALNALKRGRPAAVDFESEHIPPLERQRIALELMSAATPEAVKGVFGRDGGNGVPDEKSIMELTDALRSVALAMREQE